MNIDPKKETTKVHCKPAERDAKLAAMVRDGWMATSTRDIATEGGVIVEIVFERDAAKSGQ